MNNTVFVAAEFNTSDFSRNIATFEVNGTAQWSREKIQQIPSLRCATLSWSSLEQDVREARRRPAKPFFRHASRTQGGGVTPRCLHCGCLWSHECLRMPTQNICVECRRLQQYKWRCTLRGNMKTLLSSARSRSASRGMACTITNGDLLDILLAQEGRCFYSGVPMECLVPNSHWRMSLERLDNEQGYSRGNVALIACEFNTPDHSRNRGATTIRGTGNGRGERWNRSGEQHDLRLTSALRFNDRFGEAPSSTSEFMLPQCFLACHTGAVALRHREDVGAVGLMCLIGIRALVLLWPLVGIDFYPAPNALLPSIPTKTSSATYACLTTL